MSSLKKRLNAIEDLDEQLDDLNDLAEELMDSEGEVELLPAVLGVLERCWDQEDFGAFQALGSFVESLDGDDEIDDRKVSELLMESYSRGPCWKTLELIQVMVEPSDATRFFKIMLQRDDLDDETLEAIEGIIEELGDDLEFEDE